jgi:hypothetical protein
VTQQYKITKDDLDFAAIPCHEVPSPYFKHVPMQLYFEHMITENLDRIIANRKECQNVCKELRET